MTKKQNDKRRAQHERVFTSTLIAAFDYALRHKCKINNVMREIDEVQGDLLEYITLGLPNATKNISSSDDDIKGER